MQVPNKIKTILLVVIVIITSLLVILVIYFLNNTPRENTVDITNINSCSKDINKNILDNITGDLYTLTRQANEYNDKESLPAYKSEIRDGSCRKLEDSQFEGRSVHTSYFIVDIEEADQSWGIKYSWVAGNKDVEFDTGTIVPECLNETELRYGNFECESVLRFINTGTDKFDPVLDRLSRESTDPIYRVTSNIDDDGTKRIIIQILANNYTERTKQQFELYRQEARQWLISQGVDLSQYTLEWRNLENEIAPEGDTPDPDSYDIDLSI